MIKWISLPPYDKQPPPTERDWRLVLSIVLSVLAHLLFFLLFINNQDQNKAVLAENNQKGIEVTLSALPKAKPSLAQNSTEPTPPQPTPKPIVPPKPIVQPPKQVQLPKPLPPPKPIVKPKPIPKPPEPRPKLPTPVIEPEPPTPREPVVRPRPPRHIDKEPLPEFKDEFASLSKSYSDETQEAQGERALSTNPGHSDNGVRTGSILNINPKIRYPLSAQRQGMHGMVVVLIHIAPDGSTDGVDLLQSSGFDALDNEVLGAVQHWRFNPPRRGGKPVEGVYKHRVIFGADENVVDDFENHWREIELQPADK